MNELKRLQTGFGSKNPLIFVFLLSLSGLLVSCSVLSKNFVNAKPEAAENISETRAKNVNQPTGVWKLKEIKVFKNMDGNYGSVVKERYDKKGGEVEINISSNPHICPGGRGSEVARFAWRFVDDASRLTNGGGLGISLQAEQKSNSEPCTTELSSRSMIGVKAGAVFLNDYPQSEISRIDGDRFEGGGEGARAHAAGDGPRSISSEVRVITRETSAVKPLAVFEIDILTPTRAGGGHLRYAYVYENVQSGGDSSGGNATSSRETSSCGLGRTWDDIESGHRMTWTRQGNSNVFRVNGTVNGGSFTAEQAIKITGNKVSIDRYEASDGNTCRFEGTIQSDGVTVTGTYDCTKYKPSGGWSAKINCD